MTVLAVIRTPHSDLGEDGYHLWITFGDRVRADVNGRQNPRMWNKSWTRWICNNPECPAVALVSDAASLLAITEAEDGD